MMPARKRFAEDENDNKNYANAGSSEMESKPKKQKRSLLQDEATPDFVVKAEAEAEVGIVEKVSLTNFMCHRKLEVSLGANVNFVIGRNGSGKSAILTGLIVGLGGKANMTSRGNSLKGFIKEGCNSCTVKITLRNRGTDAFKLKEYGESIIVERRLNADGNSGYKIKSSEDKVISTKKDELLAILDQFNIQIDNPVSILTQDTARSFLNASDPKAKYAFFLKATQLEHLSLNYQRIVEEKHIQENTIASKRKILGELHEEVKKHEEKYKDMQQLESMKDKVKKLKKELAWAMVKEKKQEVEKYEAEENRLKQKIPSYEKHVADTWVKEEHMQKLFAEKEEELKSYAEEIAVLLNEKSELRAEHKKKRFSHKSAGEQSKKTESDIQQTNRDIQMLLARIDEIKSSLQRDVESERQAREEQIQTKNTNLRQYEEKLNSANQNREQLEQEIKRKKEKKYNFNKDVQDAKRRVDNKRRRLTELENQKKNKLSIFGNATESILHAIDSAHQRGQFHKKPVGPLGSLIKVKESKWTLAVEVCLKKDLMLSYACHDGHDMMVLRDIFRKTVRGKTPSIIVSSFVDQPYDVSRFKPRCPYPVVMDIIDINNPIVFNSLIDQCGMESVLLIENSEHAQKVMWDNKPQNTNKAISIKGHQILGGRSSKYYPCNRDHPEFLGGDVASTMRQLEAELLEAMRDLKHIENEVKMVDVDIKEKTSELERSRRECYSHQDCVNNVTMELRDLEGFEEEQLPDVDELEQEVEEYIEKNRTLQQNLVEVKSLLAERLSDVEEHKNILKECDERCQEAVEKLEGLKNEQNEAGTELTKIKGHKKHYTGRRDELMQNVEKATQIHEKVKAEYEEIRSQALQYCEEVETERATKSLESEIVKTQKRIDREEASRGNCDEVREKYHTALESYKESKNAIRNCERFKKSLESALRRRARRFEKFQQLLTLRARYFFEMLLSQRGYIGKMKIDHEEETLVVQVNVENTEGAATKDSKALSGGERSFSTICFIMALWDAMEAPFRCLDEFDVFMDMVNRRISMEMLMKIAKEQKNRQFVLLTPQDMSSVAGSDRVRLFKLSDPERGQQTLPFRPM